MNTVVFIGVNGVTNIIQRHSRPLSQDLIIGFTLINRSQKQKKKEDTGEDNGSSSQTER